MDYLRAIQRSVKEIELSKWVDYCLQRPLSMRNCFSLTDIKHRFLSMKKSSFFAFLFLFSLSSNIFAQGNAASIEAFLKKNTLKADKNTEGIFVTTLKEGTGKSPKTGDYVKVHYTAQLLSGKVFDKTEPAKSFVFQVGYRQVVAGLDAGVAKMKVGAKSIFYIPAELGYGSATVGTAIPANSALVYEVELLEILTLKAYDTYMRELEVVEKKEFAQRKVAQFKKDKIDINDYALSHKINAKRTTSGLSYAFIKEGKGALIEAGNIVQIHYEGFLLDGKPFDSTKDKPPFKFEIGEGKTIAGWEEGLKFFNKGAEGWLLIPSQMAYGPMGIFDKTVNIPANSVLVFKVKIVEVE
jgi:FKBP-type peptidyl-prolyl cis-trans isomerase FkpA